MSALSLDDPQPTPYSVVKRQASLDDIRRDLEHERGVRQQLQERLAYLRRAWHINHADVAVGDELGQCVDAVLDYPTKVH